MDAALLLLVDGRFPAGGHAYSAGVEAAAAVGDVVDTPTLERYLLGRIATTGRVDAAFAANSCARLQCATDADALAVLVANLDEEYSARTPSPYLRHTSRRLGRQLLRAVTRIWTTPAIGAVSAVAGGAHQPIALGAAVAAAGGDANDATALSFHHLTAAVTSAAVRLLGLDPIELAVVQERVGRRCDGFRSDATEWASMAPADLPAWGGSLTEILGEHHGSLDARMFVA
ncbi:urease accessory protein UreF [Ilumatobacter nonamiensis]|uniref:urease accessory protein UreF n=1 Tax=Ilumatobacter nonamiensis TaxID=467093 RepID=UPI000345169A|nr:urease accessory UreF family protein [Ilumatobacter nonamiensis]